MNMRTKQIAPGVEMPVLSIGTGGIERMYANEIITNWLELGGRGIDTALNYKNQENVRDSIVAFISKPNTTTTRKDLFVTTKVPNCENVGRTVKKDLQELDMEYIDLVLIHNPRSGGNCTQAWTELESFFASNEARTIGVSNFDKKDLEPILRIAKVKPHVNQIRLNVLQNNPDTIDYSTQHGIMIQSYSPLGRNNTSSRGVDIPGNPTIQRIASIHNVTTYQIAIKWIVQHGWITTFQSSSKEHQAVDANVFSFTLTSNEMEELDGLSNFPSTILLPSKSSSDNKGNKTVCWECFRGGVLIFTTTIILMFLLISLILKKCCHQRKRRRKQKRHYKKQSDNDDDDDSVVDFGDGLYNDDGSTSDAVNEDGFTSAETEML